MKSLAEKVAVFAFVVASASCTGVGDDDGGTSGCPRELAPEDRVRYGVAGFPFDAASPNDWEIVELAADGALSFTGTRFQMGKAQTVGEVGFTPDGEIGIAAQDDGTLGVFAIDGNGNPTVIHAGFSGDFYAHRVVMDPSGERAWIVDRNTIENGGGIYSVEIGCDGTLLDEGLIAAGNSTSALKLLAGGSAIAYSKGLLDSEAGDDLFEMTLSPAAILSGVDAFPSDDDSIVADVALTSDANFALVADNSAFGSGTRVSVVDFAPAEPAQAQTIDIEDPISFAVSSENDVVLVASGFGDAVFVLDYDAGSVPPLALRGEMTYTGGSPPLPGAMVTMTRGQVNQTVYLAELQAIRRIRFDGGGAVTDLGPEPSGTGSGSIVGAIGFPR